MKYLILTTLFVTPALAQPIPTAAQRCGNVVGALEAEYSSLGEKYDRLMLAQQQAQARIKELEDKYEPKK